MKELRAYLSAHGLTASEFADIIGAAQPTVSRVLSGKRKPGPKLSLKIERKTKGQVPRHVLRPDLWSAAA